MKLLECHVDNFGKLSNYDYRFSEGLTVIQEPNGFGKSTLAAFIKAMLYGFPRTAGRSVAGNERKKYLPWQGGTYGGSLDFEFDGTAYRVWRTFGKTAAKDTFKLWDLTNRRESKHFSEKLGEELFQLDAESFMRSVYMSQSQNTDTTATTSIQAKLGNLVDNTDDLNNYDSAMERLRTARSNYRKFRGNGGLIDGIQEQIEQTERDLAQAETQKDPLERKTEIVEKLCQEKEQRDDILSAIREKITKASAQQATQTLRDQFTELEKDLHDAESAAQALDQSYPKGYPTKTEIAEQSKNILTIGNSQKDLIQLKLRPEDVQYETQNRELFVDETETDAAIRECQKDCEEFVKATERANVQVRKKELERREKLSRLFQAGEPSDQELRECKDKVRDLSQKQGELTAHQLTAAEANSLSELLQFFDGKSVNEQELDQCKKAEEKIRDCQSKLQNSGLSEKDQGEWKRLSRIFSIAVPEEEKIRQKQYDCRRIDALNNKKETKTVVLQPVQEPKAEKKTNATGLMAGSVLLIAIGVVCFVLSKIAVGAILAVAGFAGILLVLWGRTKQMPNHGATQVAVESSAISEAEIQELYTLQKDVAEFILKFYGDASEPNAKLVNLLLDRKAYLQLQEQKHQQEKEADALCAEIEEQQKLLQGIFQRFYSNQPYQDGFAAELQERWKEYNRLLERQKSILSEREKRKAEINRIENELREEFGKYYPTDEAEDFSEQLTRLENDRNELHKLNSEWDDAKKTREEAEIKTRELEGKIQEVLKKYKVCSEEIPYGEALETLRTKFTAYQNAAKNVKGYYAEKEKLDERIASAEERLKQFAQTYGFALPLKEEVLDRISDDVNTHASQQKRYEEAQAKRTKFQTEHPEFKNGLSEEQKKQEKLPAVDALIEAEKVEKEKLEKLAENLQTARGERAKLLQVVEQIPEMEDQIGRLTEQRKEAESSCAVLDKTLELMETAKNNLSNQYVGGVERNFAAYMQELLGSDFGSTLVDHDLTIHVDEKGEAREIDYFSAGTIDSILLCMRLALVDALFKQEKPFILLDDPFVNLDDEHTKSALQMLQEIAQNRQVIYMVCNSSRC